MRPTTIAAIVASAALFWGCGVTVTHDGTSGPGGTGPGGTGPGGTGPGGTGPGGGDVCAPFDDQASPGEVTVRIVNQTDRAVFVEAGCGTIPFDVFPTAGGEENVSYTYDDLCLSTCEMIRKGEFGACPDCAPSVYLIPIGDSLEWTWDATLLRHELAMPASCWPDQVGGTCSRIEALPSEEYRVSTEVWDTCEGCGCEENAGTAQCWGTPSGASAYGAVQTFYPNEGLVEIVLDPCAFGCPDG